MSESTPVAFVNKGLVQKKDPAQLGPGEFYQLSNAWSQQEGSLTARTGHQNLLPSPQTSLSSPVVSLSKLNLGGADGNNPRYMGTGTVIDRTGLTLYVSGVVTTSGTSVLWVSGGTFNAAWVGKPITINSSNYTVLSVSTPVTMTLTSSAGNHSNVAYSTPYYETTSVYTGLNSGQRWSAQQYNAGTAGTPSLFFATEKASIRDNGSYTTLQKWGVDPPPIPVSATINVPNDTSLNIVPGATQRFIANVNSNASHQKTLELNTPIVNLSGSSGDWYSKITPNTNTGVDDTNGVNGIYVGMLLKITDSNLSDSETIIVLAVDSTSCYGITIYDHSSSPYGDITLTASVSSTQTLTSGQTQVSYYGSGEGFPINAAFNGAASNGYSTDDPFHIALSVVPGSVVSSLDFINNVLIQIVPNYTATPNVGDPPSGGTNSTDYYQYTISPASVMSPGTTDSPAWYEVNIPKNAFTPVGNAGSGAFTWQNITQIYVIFNYTESSVPVDTTFQIADVYFTGGGGLNDSAAGTTSYDWLYTFRNPTTQAEGNPCPYMITANLPAPITNGAVTLTLTGTAQAATQANGIYEISGPGSISIYRRGGTFSDGLFRHIGYAANPGSGATVQFVDNASDASLDTADTLQFDNDPPVPSSLPVPLTANILEFQPSGGGTDYATSSQAIGGSATALTTNAIVRMVLSNLPTNFVAADIATPGTIYNITVGSTISVGFGTTSETCIITSIGYDTNGHTTSAWFETYLQYNHSTTANDSSETIECDAILRGTCDLVHQDFDCIFLAGDNNNPATLYQSKVGRPEAFPVVNLENDFAQQINVGSPSNPINGITSIGPGELVCLNLNNIFIIQVWAGQMQQPIQAPASRGLYSKWCWCKGDNRIWYLAYDGIYTWAGGESQKVSEKIDYLFKNQTVNGILPINFQLAGIFSFSYAENCLFIAYIDVEGLYHRLRYETIYDRWTIDDIIDGNGDVYGITSLFTEPDTGNFLVGITNAASASYLWLCDFYSTTDGWNVSSYDGLPIKYNAWRYWPIANPSADYQIGEVLLELENANDAVDANLFFNYSTTATNALTIASGTQATRGRYFAAVNSAVGVVQYSIGLQLTGTTGSNTPIVAFYTFQWRDFPWTGSANGLPQEFGWLDIDVNTNGVAVPMQLQIDGVAAYSFSVSGTFFNRASTIVLPQGLTGIQWRIVPVTGNSGTIQIYKITPHDYAWSDSGYGCPKTFGWLEIQVNTNGISVPMQFQLDGGAETFNFSVTGTYFNRTNIITLPSNLTGTLWRIVPLTAGYAGIIQIFSVNPKYESLPCPITHYDSLMQVYGSAGWKFIYQVWLDYESTVPLVFSIYRDGDVLFYQATVPSHPQREVARFYLPTVNSPAGGMGPVFNKSQSYQCLLDASDGETPFQLYRDGSRMEVRPLDGDQRSGFSQVIIWEKMPLQA